MMSMTRGLKLMPKRLISPSDFRERQLDEGATDLNRVFTDMRNAYRVGHVIPQKSGSHKWQRGLTLLISCLLSLH